MLGQSIGPPGKYIFLGGAFAAAFSSVLGVWQSVPYIYADVWRLRNHVGKGESAGELPPVDTKSRVYKATLLLIATVPMLGVLFKFNDIQLIYAFIGAFFIPGLALACLILTSRKSLIGGRYTSSILTKCVLVLAIVFFTVAGTLEVKNKLGKRSKQAETPAQSPAN
ncbi:MAG: hypothetical protein KDA34_10875 [Phycisphaerales bacterium]|nr:hypothetical protein [Phycisphaerales bacterium]